MSNNLRAEIRNRIGNIIKYTRTKMKKYSTTQGAKRYHRNTDHLLLYINNTAYYNIRLVTKYRIYDGRGENQTNNGTAS